MGARPFAQINGVRLFREEDTYKLAAREVSRKSWTARGYDYEDHGLSPEYGYPSFPVGPCPGRSDSGTPWCR